MPLILLNIYLPSFDYEPKEKAKLLYQIIRTFEYLT